MKPASTSRSTRVIVEPVAERGVARVAIGVVRLGEHRGRDPGRARALEPAGVRAAGGHAHDLDAVAAVHGVDDRLEVGALARDEDADAEAHAAAAG